ncbi:MAG: hypothetical protein MJZ39_04445 [Bacteroidales bacterium]|nr:hypothetical protein [Bacteroidales bacterium]
MKEFLSVLLMLVIWLVPVIVKSKREKAKNLSTSRPVLEEEDPFEEDALEMESDFQNVGSNPDNSQEYFTYESDDFSFEKDKIQEHSAVDKSAQTIEIEQEAPTDLSFDKDELVKGVIYSEILKRKYN